MKYLIYVKDRTTGPAPQDPIALNRAVREWVEARLRDGLAVGAQRELVQMHGDAGR